MPRKHYTILHCSDLHIADPDDPDYLANRDRYKNYIQGLRNTVNDAGSVGDGVDTIVITGDLVDRARVEHFGHARLMIDELCECFAVSAERVVLTPGNHDVVFVDEGSNLKAFHEFAGRFSPAAEVPGTNALVWNAPFTEDVLMLAFDTTHPTMHNRPREFTQAEVDRIFAFIEKTHSRVIVGCSHYPIPVPNPYAALQGEAEWGEKHVCGTLQTLADRIREMWPERRLVWLCGDVHQPLYVRENRITHIVTSPFSGPRDSAAEPYQANIIRVPLDPGDIELFPFFRRKKPLTKQHLNYRWELGTVTWKTITEQSQTTSSTSNAASRRAYPESQDADDHKNLEYLDPEGHPEPAPPVECNTAVMPAPDTSRLATLCPGVRDSETSTAQPLDEQVAECIRGGNYQLGRFPLDDGRIALARIRSAGFMNEHHTVQRVVRVLSEWTRDYAATSGSQDPRDAERTLLIGIDLWGSILAALLGIRTGFEVIQLDSRLSDAAITDEQLRAPGSIEHNDWIRGRVAENKTLVLVVDAVTTGKSLARAWANIAAIAGLDPAGGASPRIAAVSAICDTSRECPEYLGFLDRHVTTCGLLPIPIVESHELPKPELLGDDPKHRPPTLYSDASPERWS